MIPLLAYQGPMGEDEVFILIVSALLVAVLWARRAAHAALLHPMVGRPLQRLAVAATTPALAATLALALNTFAASDVRGDFRYIALFTALGLAWSELLATLAFPFLGVLAPRESMQRADAPSILLHASAMLALTLAYAGANFGDGPGWWVVLLSAALSTGVLLIQWGVIEVVSKHSERVTIDRDAASAMRLSAALIASGMILGRAVAGTWHSGANLIADFGLLAWPSLALVVAEPALSLLARPTPANPRPSLALAGAIPALAYLAYGAWIVWLHGWWV